MGTDYKSYDPGTMVIIKATGETGEAFESTMGFISVWVGDNRHPQIFDIEFINEKN